jgi:hypothetical protein
MVTTGPLSHTDDDGPMSPDSSFVICLSAHTRGAALEDDQQSPETAGAAPDEDVVEEPINEQSLAPTVIMRSPTVSAVVAAVKTGKKTTSAATAPTPTSRLTKVPNKARTGTPTVETLRQKRSSGHADRGNAVITAEKPATAAAAAAVVSPGSRTEENKAPSPGRSKNPIGLPSLNRARTASAQPASCGKQAAPATTTTTTRTSPPAAAAPLGLKRAAPTAATSSQSPVGLGGGSLPLPPSKRARTSSSSPTATDALTEHGLKRKSLRTSFAAPDSKQQQQQDIPLNNTKTTTAATAAQPQRESRRQRTASTKKSTTRVPAWVQKAAEAPQVNALLLSAVEKVKPSRGCGGNGAYPAWNIAGETLKGRIRQNVNVEDPSNNEGSTRKRRKRPDDEILDTTTVTTATATATATTDNKVDVNGIERFKTKTRFIPGWEAVLQTVDVAPRECEESETVAELLVQGEHKRLKYNIHREYTLLKNTTNKSEYSSPGSPGMLKGNSTGALTRADGSLYRQGFGISEFAARMSLVASGLTEDAAAKESFAQRAKRIISNNQTTGTLAAAAAVANNNGGTSAGAAGSRLREATAEKTKKSKNASSSSLKPEDHQKERAPFALGHAISNAVALAKRTDLVVSFNNNPRSRKSGSVARKPGPKPRSGNTHNGLSSGGDGGGGRRSKGGAGTSSRLRNTVTSLETDPATGTTTLTLTFPTTTTAGHRITAPPKVWPPLDIQFISKGEKEGNSINVNDVSRSNKFSGSGLDAKLWNKLYQEKAQANR